MMQRLTNLVRAKGAIKERADDFVVEEISDSGTVLEINKTYTPDMLGMPEVQDGKFTLFVLQKSNWNTIQALKSVAGKVGRGFGSIGFAGTKDRISKSTQLCSIFGVRPDALGSVHVKDISINGAWKYDTNIEMGDLAGNRFTITIRDAQDSSNIPPILQSLSGKFPNYFGSQRFGSRGNNFEIGLDILKGDYKGAVMRFLTDSKNEARAEASEARNRLAKEQDFKAALNYFPLYLKYERTMIDYLSRFDGNFANAIVKLPRQLSLMFVHSVEDKIFNSELEQMIKDGHTQPRKGDRVCPADEARFYNLSETSIYGEPNSKNAEFMVANVLGHQTRYPTEFENNAMEKLGITLESFKSKGLTELNCKGASRVMFAPCKNLKNYPNEGQLTLQFSLPAGSYATVFMDELVEQKESTPAIDDD